MSTKFKHLLTLFFPKKQVSELIYQIPEIFMSHKYCLLMYRRLLAPTPLATRRNKENKLLSQEDEISHYGNSNSHSG